MSTELRNWAGNYAYHAARVHRPQSVDEIRDLVGRSAKVRALGTRHSFNNIADSTEDLISLEHFDRLIGIDREHRTVTIEAGMKYGRLGRYLHGEGYALHNLASLPHISVAGACATATHGSGDSSGNLATAVSAMEVVTADGQVVELSRERHGEQFQGMVVSLGGLGVVTKLTLNIGDAFLVRQDVYEKLPLAQLEEHCQAIFASGYSVSLFTDWQSDCINQIWRKRKVAAANDEAAAPFFGAVPAPRNRHPIAEVSAENCTPQMGAAGPWYERLPHFRMDYTPSSGQELQSEYFVPRNHAVTAIGAIAQLRKQIAPVLMISELRTIAADEMWMSPCHQRASLAIHFTWKQDWPAVRKLLVEIEGRLAPFEARPHWGKLFTMSPQLLQRLYPKMPEFRELLTSFDPRGKFRNAFLDRYIFGA
jgi:alditol oxidase